MSEESPEVLHVSTEIVRAENERVLPVDLVIYNADKRIVVGKAGYNGKHIVARLDPDMPDFARTMLRQVKGEFIFQLPRGITLFETVEEPVIDEADDILREAFGVDGYGDSPVDDL